MAKLTMALKIHIHVVIFLERQQQKLERKKDRIFRMGNFMAVSSHLNNVRPTTKIINTHFPNEQIIRSTMEGELDLPMLPSTAIYAHIFPNIKHSLVYIIALYDAGCIVTFIIKDVTAMYKNNIILRGWINHLNKLWYFPLAIGNEDEKVRDYKNNPVNNVYDNKIQAELPIFLHATCFSPIKLTLIKSVKNGNFATWPGITPKLITTHITKSEATVFGH